MTRLAIRIFLAFAWTSLVTGAIYGVMRYTPVAIDPLDDSFDLLAHPSQPFFQHAHILLSAGLALMIGYIAGCHGIPHTLNRVHRRRRSGLVFLFSAVPMVFSGYALQISTGELTRPFWSVIHIATSLLWSGALMAHTLFVLPKRPAHSEQQPDGNVA